MRGRVRLTVSAAACVCAGLLLYALTSHSRASRPVPPIDKIAAITTETATFAAG